MWIISYTETAKKQLRKLDKQAVKQILDYIDERVATKDDPRAVGKALTGQFGGFWRYRVGNYRIICEIQDSKLCILVVRLGGRKDIYR